ncbi:hypothetical protein ACFLT0_00300 [Chloroflexota bacterium]
MKIEKIADGAYFVPSYSEQTIAWSPFGYTIQGLVFEETVEGAEPIFMDTDRQKLELDITKEFEFADAEATQLIDEAG